MTFVVPPDRWSLARTALRTAADRFRSLLSDGCGPDTMATADWTVAQSAAHVLAIARLYVPLVDDGAETLPVPDLAEILATTSVDTVADLNDHVLAHFEERDPRRLSALLDDAVEEILTATRGTAPETTVRWVGDSLVPVAGLLAHLTNELLVHGWDIARALRSPWSIPDDHAALYWELFFIGMLRHRYGALLNTALPAPKQPIAVQFRSAYTPTATIVLGNARVWLAPPDDPYDVRVTFRPAGFNLMLFGRTSTVTAVLRRDVVIGGPRPWRLPAFLRVVHMPNLRLAPPVPRRGAA